MRVVTLWFPAMSINTPSVWITGLVFSDGSHIPCSPNEALVIVGPNNSGKSEALRGMRDRLQNPAHNNPVITKLTISRSGTDTDLLISLEGWANKNAEAQPGNPMFSILGLGIYERQCRSEWQRSDNGIGQLCRWFCHLLTAEESLHVTDPPATIALSRDAPVHPIHFLMRDDKLELTLSRRFRNAFGADLIVHRNAGSQVPLYVGDRPTPEAGEDRVSLSYVKKLEALPTLHKQGDGMRAFAGTVLATSVGRESVLLIDEPEAFLHPPQARLLGTSLVQHRVKGHQLFVATHSADVLRGFLDSDSSDVRVLRLTREAALNRARLLDNDRIRELWGDPLLRFSNILDGLFHECVVACEADADCRFFSAVYDTIAGESSDGARRLHVMFTHSGGKARLPVVVRALRGVDVPVKVIADFDILADEHPLRDILDALGLHWADVSDDWKLVKSSIDGKKPELGTSEVSDEINRVLVKITENTFPSRAKDEIQAILRRSSPWSNAKSVGKAFVPSGQPTRACEHLLETFRRAGLHVVELGELEGFVRTIGGHGPKWVNAALQRDLSKDPELSSARDFVRKLFSTDVTAS